MAVRTDLAVCTKLGLDHAEQPIRLRHVCIYFIHFFFAGLGPLGFLETKAWDTELQDGAGRPHYRRSTLNVIAANGTWPRRLFEIGFFCFVSKFFLPDACGRNGTPSLSGRVSAAARPFGGGGGAN